MALSAPAERRIPLCEPRLDGNEGRYLSECVASGWVSSGGPFVERFESAVAGLVGVPHAVATNSGTAALHLALRTAGVGPGDAVVVPALSFIAPANAVRYVGALPLFVDVEPRCGQLDPERFAALLARDGQRVGPGIRHRPTGRRVAAVIAVHLLGHPVDLAPLLATAERFGIAVIEDAAEALGARYRGRPVGGFGALSCFSFNGNKTVTAGGGGMLVTANAGWARRARHLSTQAKDDPVESVHGELGFNYRLTNLSAAVGCAQLERIEALLRDKRRIAADYARAVAELPGIEPLPVAPWAESSHWLSAVRVDAARTGCGSRELLAHLRGRSVEARPLWQPLHRSPAHADAPRAECPVAERLHREVLCLPSSPSLGGDDVEYVVSELRAALRGR